MTAIVEVEGGVAGRGLDGVVVGKLGDVKVLVPIGEVGVDVGAQNLFEGAVGALRLAVCLGVEGSGHIEAGADGGHNCLPEAGLETGVTI